MGCQFCQHVAQTDFCPSARSVTSGKYAVGQREKKEKENDADKTL